MRKIASLFVVFGAVVAQFSTARAETVVLHLPANNRMAIANSTAADGTSIQIGVTRELKGSGAPVDRLNIIIFNPNTGDFTFATGILPTGAFHYDSHSASVEVDVADIKFDQPVIGDFPESGVISVDWEGTATTRTAGNNILEFDNVRVVFAGVRTEVVADVDGTLFGVPLANTSGSLQSLSQQVTIITRN